MSSGTGRGSPALRRSAVLVAVVAAAGLVLVGLRWRKSALGRRGPDDDGGLAGVREPRRPLPPTLVDAGAAEGD